MAENSRLDEETLARIRAEEEAQYRAQLEEEARQRIRQEVRGEVEVGTSLAASSATGSAGATPIVLAPHSATTAVLSAPPAPVQPASRSTVQPWVPIILCAIIGRFALAALLGMITDATGWSSFLWLRVADTLIGAAAIWAGMAVAKEPKEDAALRLAIGFVVVYLLGAALFTRELGWMAWGEALFLAIGSGTAAGMYKDSPVERTSA